MSSEVLGRGAELATVRTFVAAPAEGPRGLLIVGEAGIGKTTMWQEGVRLAGERGHHILWSSPVEAEAKLAYAALGDLVHPVLDQTLGALPPPQRRAMEIALLLADPEGIHPDRRAVGLAVLAALRTLAARGPVTVAIDDIQWLDAATARVLTFAIRRLDRARIGVLATVRREIDADDPLQLADALPPGAMTRLTLGPLTLETLARLLRARSSVGLSKPLLARLRDASGGNPLVFLELARAISEAGGDVEPGKPLPVPEDVTGLLRARLRDLPDECRAPLLHAALLVKPTRLTIRLVSDDPAEAEAGLLRGKDSGVVVMDDDEVRFSHPLLASAVYAEASIDERRHAHRRIAAATIDPEERARHLALASSGPDEQVAAGLEAAAHHAGGRGAPDVAAELAELAARLTPLGDSTTRHHRRLQEARYRYDAGDVRGARAEAEDLAASSSGPDRAHALMLWIRSLGTDARRIAGLAEELLAEAGNDPSLLTLASMTLSGVTSRSGTIAEAAEHAARALTFAERSRDPNLLAGALAEAGLIEVMRGMDGSAMLDRASRLEDEVDRAGPHVSVREYVGRRLLWAGDLEGARSALRQCLASAEDQGLETIRQGPLTWLAEVELRAGHLDRALGLAEEAMEICLEHGSVESLGPPRCVRAMVLAWRGEVNEARADAEATLEQAIAHGCRPDEIASRSVLGLVSLSTGDPAGTVRDLRPAAALLEAMGIEEPGMFRFVPDLAEALIGVGELDEAHGLARRLEGIATERNRPLARAVAARCLGLVTAARGRIDEALRELDRALEEHEHAAEPLELGRTLFVRGEILRRGKRRRESREALGRALQLFEGLGASVWATRVRAGMDRIGGRAQSALALTPTEAQIAALVAVGRTNTEVAGDLFISIKTVEANLSKVYRKLGIRSRRELPAVLPHRSENGQT